MPPLTDDDRELLRLADEVGRMAESARNLVLRADTQAFVARFASIEAQKAQERRRLQRMLRAWRDIRDEDGAPYRDARMLFTEAIQFYGAVLRADRERERTGIPAFTKTGRRRLRGGLPAVDPAPAPGEAVQRQRAEIVAATIASHYPKLGAKVNEPARIERIRAAIASVATSARRMPWKAIAAAWDGIEARPRDPGEWRSTWDKHRRRPHNRT